ncbi:MAG: endonuclease/exonuclease/phosphatase family protein [Thermoanaerobaculia bacterium]
MTITIFGGKVPPAKEPKLPRRAPAKRRGRKGSPAEPPPATPRPAADGLRLMSLNIAHARRKSQHQSLLRETTIRRNLELIAGVIQREEPQVVALQEADGPSSWSGKFDHVGMLSDLAGYPHSFRGEHNPPALARFDVSYGTALLSRLPLDGPHSLAFQQNWRDTKGFVAATIAPEALGGESVDVVSIHLDFLADRVRRQQVEQLVETFRDHQRHLIVMGDFNCAWSERRRSLGLLHRELKLRPFRDLASPTYPAWRPLVRLDWILISEGLDFTNYQTLDDHVSDHLGILADVRLRGESARSGKSEADEAEGDQPPRRLPSVSLA